MYFIYHVNYNSYIKLLQSDTFLLNKTLSPHLIEEYIQFGLIFFEKKQNLMQRLKTLCVLYIQLERLW